MLAQPGAELPENLSELGLYPYAGDFDEVHPRALLYRPAHELWSNGSHKRRHLIVPEGAVVDTSERDHWRFPRGTLLLKTFFYRRADDTEYPVETRALLSDGERFEYAAYVWDEAGTDATRADLKEPIAIAVSNDDGPLVHHVPARIDCRKCHESQPVAALGFDELGLSEPLAGEDRSQLEALFEAGVISDLPDAPALLEHPDRRTRAVLGYLEGNCVHCHNGSDGASSSFELRHPVALSNLIDRETEGESVGGIRLVPGDADNSALYRALEGGRLFPDVAAMPPVGVDVRDEGAIELIRDWINDMPEEAP